MTPESTTPEPTSSPSQAGERRPARLVLASKSRARTALMAGAGLRFEAEPSHVDERAVEEAHLAAGASPARIAEVLAEAKALDVAARRPGDLVLGADQTLGFEGRRYVKAETIAAARDQLLSLRGQTHALHSALALARDGDIVWTHTGTALLTMRAFSESFLDAYLEQVGDRVLSSVGGYELEHAGIQLFDRIEGDYFTILGLPLLPLLAELRRIGWEPT